ncbi:hypothetical protein VCHA53O466_50428 [Vibrio chagasii]|nr:hypothetical protein VCHA53O466_50428 [Vibrio chagasii]
MRKSLAVIVPLILWGCGGEELESTEQNEASIPTTEELIFVDSRMSEFYELHQKIVSSDVEDANVMADMILNSFNGNYIPLKGKYEDNLVEITNGISQNITEVEAGRDEQSSAFNENCGDTPKWNTESCNDVGEAIAEANTLINKLQADLSNAKSKIESDMNNALSRVHVDHVNELRAFAGTARISL